MAALCGLSRCTPSYNFDGTDSRLASSFKIRFSILPLILFTIHQ